jgi:hypothetical protein
MLERLLRRSRYSRPHAQVPAPIVQTQIVVMATGLDHVYVARVLTHAVNMFPFGPDYIKTFESVRYLGQQNTTKRVSEDDIYRLAHKRPRSVDIFGGVRHGIIAVDIDLLVEMSASVQSFWQALFVPPSPETHT